MTPYFRVYVNDDIRGVEVGGSLKNVIAVAAGISDGAGFGDNTKAALMTRGIYEITRLGVKLGAHPKTFAGLSVCSILISPCAEIVILRHTVHSHFLVVASWACFISVQLEILEPLSQEYQILT